MPRFLVEREFDQGRAASVLRIAEAHYNAYAKQYHPDLPEGDADLMASFSEAIGYLRDPDSLEVFIEEYLDGTVRQQTATGRADASIRERDKRAFTAATSLFDVVNQWEVLETDKPLTLFTTDGRARHVYNALSPFHTEVYAVNLLDDQLPLDMEQLKYEKGVWSEVYIVRDRMRRKSHTDLLRLSDVRIIGSVPHSALNAHDSLVNDQSHASGMLGAGGVNARLGFTDPQHAWYLADLVPQCIVGNNIVLWARGKVALGTLVEQIEVIQ